MLTTRKEIIAKIDDLPVDYADHVRIGRGGTAVVKSFSSSTTHTVHIEQTQKEGELRVNCTCPATRLCRHVIAFYAVAKDIEPNMPIEEELAIQMSFDF